MEKTVTIVFHDVKSADGWAEMMTKLGVPQEKWDEYLHYGEYGSLELEFDSHLKVISGRLLPR